MSPALVALALGGGLAVLAVGTDALIRGATRLALLAGVSPLVVGLTVVAMGTSAPELAVCVRAGLGGNPAIAAGNVVGSSIFNLLFILGAAAVVAPLVVTRQVIRLEVPMVIGASLLAWALCLDHRLGAAEGAALVALLVAYTAWNVWRGRREVAARRERAAPVEEATPGTILFAVGLAVAGAGLLVLGARWFVDGSVGLARLLGVSDLVIGLTVVAAGTSIPEVAATVVATVRGERDLAIGHVIGANLVNVLGVLGTTALVTPGGLVLAPSIVEFDIPVMTAVAAACLPIFLTGHGLGRLPALVFLGYYGAYVSFLVLQAARHDALEAFSSVMVEFVVPLTLLGIGVSLWRSRRSLGGGFAPY